MNNKKKYLVVITLIMGIVLLGLIGLPKISWKIFKNNGNLKDLGKSEVLIGEVFQLNYPVDSKNTWFLGIQNLDTGEDHVTNLECVSFLNKKSKLKVKETKIGKDKYLFITPVLSAKNKDNYSTFFINSKGATYLNYASPTLRLTTSAINNLLKTSKFCGTYNKDLYAKVLKKKIIDSKLTLPKIPFSLTIEADKINLTGSTKGNYQIEIGVSKSSIVAKKSINKEVWLGIQNVIVKDNQELPAGSQQPAIEPSESISNILPDETLPNSSEKESGTPTETTTPEIVNEATPTPTENPSGGGTSSPTPTEKPVEKIKEETPTPTEDPSGGGSTNPTQEPTAEPTTDPTQEPTAEPTSDPTQDPTSEPTTDPIQEPTAEPTTDPTQEPTSDPTQDPTSEPTSDPTQEPTSEPTTDPTQEPTTEPTTDPTQEPTTEPTTDPTQEPTSDPTQEPTSEPTSDPTQEPTSEPTADPTQEPTAEPTTDPTQEPTAEPTTDPTQEPTATPTPRCEDADGANVTAFNPAIQFDSQDQETNRIYDECLDKTTINEAICDEENNSPIHSYMTCATDECCAAGACSKENCTDKCGDGNITGDEECDDGDNNGKPDSTCRSDCTKNCCTCYHQTECNGDAIEDAAHFEQECEKFFDNNKCEGENRVKIPYISKYNNEKKLSICTETLAKNDVCERPTRQIQGHSNETGLDSCIDLAYTLCLEDFSENGVCTTKIDFRSCLDFREKDKLDAKLSELQAKIPKGCVVDIEGSTHIYCSARPVNPRTKIKVSCEVIENKPSKCKDLEGNMCRYKLHGWFPGGLANPIPCLEEPQGECPKIGEIFCCPDIPVDDATETADGTLTKDKSLCE